MGNYERMSEGKLLIEPKWCFERGGQPSEISQRHDSRDQGLNFMVELSPCRDQLPVFHILLQRSVWRRESVWPRAGISK